MFFYVCVCRSLANGLSEWNKKAQDIFSFRGSGHYYFDQNCSIDNITYPCSLNHLVNSHFILLKLVNEANDVLSVIVGSYFATQVSKFLVVQKFLPK